MKITCEYVELVDPKTLVHYKKNRNDHSKEQIDRLCKLIEHHGFRNPIIVSKLSGQVVAGNGRLMAALQMGLEKVPVSFQDFDSEDEEYTYSVSDNAIALWAELDFSGINTDLGDLGPDFDIDLLGIKNFEIDVADKDPGCDEDEVPDVKEPISKPGDLYILGRHRLLCGDSTDILQVEKLLDGQRAEMVFTDPPYGVNYEGGHFHSGDVNIKRKREKLVNDENADIYADVCPLIANVCDGPVYMWFADCKGHTVFNAVNAVGELHAMIIWHKINATYAAMNAQYKIRHEPCLYWKPKGKTLKWEGPTNECTLWEMKKDSSNKLHPTQKPVELAERAISNHSAKTVLDLFGGSGSTLIACEKTNRTCYMSELDPHYIDVIVSRYCKYTKTNKVIRNGEEIEWGVE